MNRVGKYEVCEYADSAGGFYGFNTRTGEVVEESKYKKVVVKKLLIRHEKDKGR